MRIGMNWNLMDDAVTFIDRLKLALFIITSSKFTKGEVTSKFEKSWSNWQESSYSVFVNSGSSANLLMVAAIKELYKLKEGDKIIVPMCTWVTNVSPIIQLGLQPIFCDINLNDFSFDYEELKKIKSNHSDIKCIFVTHLLGFPANIPLIKEIFPEAIILEDCCESHGAVLDSIKVGNLGLCSSFSFYFGHHMTTIEGGMVCTDDLDVYKMLLLKRSHGLARELPKQFFDEESKKHPEINEKFLFLTDGYNLRSTEINAYLGILQLDRLNKIIEIRRDNFSYFINAFLKHYEDFFYIPNKDGNSSFCLPLIFKDQEFYSKLKLALDWNGIEYRPVVSGNLLKQPFLSKYNNYTNCKNANIVNDNGIYVGNNQFVERKHIDFLADIMHSVICQ